MSNKDRLDGIFDNYEQRKKERERENLRNFAGTYNKNHGKPGHNFEDIMDRSYGGGADPAKEQAKETERATVKEVEVKMVKRVLLLGGPFDKKAKYIPDHHKPETVRFDIDDKSHCLYKYKGKNPKGEGVYEYLTTNVTEG